ncbi:ABC transporter permease, partial [Candidatus Bathyarchaeota archaeon]|nr:ABC transporter permease [Candidatus Bathyarchaeota archaeon]
MQTSSRFRIPLLWVIAFITFFHTKLHLSTTPSFTKIAFRDIPRRKLRNILTMLAIILGVALVIGVNVTLDSVLYQFEDAARKATGNVDIIITSLEDTPFDEDVLTTVRGIDDVSNASGRVSNTVLVTQAGSDIRVATMIGVNSSSDFDYLNLNITQTVTLDVNSTQVVVDESLNYDVGDTFRIYVVTQLEQMDPLDQFDMNQSILFTVVGTNHPTQGSRGRTLYVDYVTAQRICGCPGKV